MGNKYMYFASSNSIVMVATESNRDATGILACDVLNKLVLKDEAIVTEGVDFEFFDKMKSYYYVECGCGWHGSSEHLDGGGQIADTGDYSDCHCPICGNDAEDMFEIDLPETGAFIAVPLYVEPNYKKDPEQHDRLRTIMDICHGGGNYSEKMQKLFDAFTFENKAIRRVSMDMDEIQITPSLIAGSIVPEDLPPYLYAGNGLFVGTVTKDGIDFDAQKFVETVIIRTEVPVRLAGYLDRLMFRNYMMENQYGNAFDNAHDSFMSLLSSKGLFFKNPISKPDFKAKYVGDMPSKDYHYVQKKDAWQKMEDGLIKGKLLIFKKN